MVNRLLVLLYPLILGSCVSVSTLEIHVLEPASNPLTPGINSIALVSRISDSETVKYDNVLYSPYLAAMETLFSLAYILNESPAIDYIDSNLVKVELNNAGLRKTPVPINPGSIVDLCRRLDTDAVLSLELYQVEYDSTIVLEPGVKATQWFDYYQGEVNVIFVALWRAYGAADGYPVDEFIITDTLTWQFASYYRWLLVDYLPSPYETLMEASYMVALDYARRIAPFWMEEERSYFSRGNLRMRRASGHIANNRLDQAETILLDLLDRQNTNTVAAAYHNLALIYELRGDYREALLLARKSYQNRMHPLMAGYIEILEERLEKSHELDRQLGRIN